jgi:hypothetical protein
MSENTENTVTLTQVNAEDLEAAKAACLEAVAAKVAELQTAATDSNEV